MISEFHQLSDKVSQLAELAHSLRRENADLRLTIASLGAENRELAARIEQAYQRVAALLEKFPAADVAEAEEEQDEEAA
jgi:regulator of replication initiation timing